MGGDFNVHHLLWNPSGYAQHDEEADILVELITELGLNSLLLSRTITYPNAGTAIDLMWGNDQAVSQLITC